MVGPNPQQGGVAVFQGGGHLPLGRQAVLHRDHHAAHVLYIPLAQVLLPVDRAEEKASAVVEEQAGQGGFLPLAGGVHPNFHLGRTVGTGNHLVPSLHLGVLPQVGQFCGVALGDKLLQVLKVKAG